MDAYDEVIEFAAIEVIISANGGIQSIKPLLDTLIRGAERITSKHSVLTGITMPDIADPKVPTISCVAEFLQEHKGHYWVSYGLQFDLNWLNHSILINSNSSYFATVGIKGICLLDASVQLMGRKLSLDDLLRVRRVLHRAGPDADLHCKALTYLMKQLGWKQVLANLKPFVPMEIDD